MHHPKTQPMLLHFESILFSNLCSFWCRISRPQCLSKLANIRYDNKQSCKERPAPGCYSLVGVVHLRIEVAPWELWYGEQILSIWNFCSMLTDLQGPPFLEWRWQGNHRGLQGIQQKCTTGKKEDPDYEEQANSQHAAKVLPVHHKLVGRRKLCAYPSPKVLPGSFDSNIKRDQLFFRRSCKRLMYLQLNERQSKRGKSRSSL